MEGTHLPVPTDAADHPGSPKLRNFLGAESAAGLCLDLWRELAIAKQPR